MEDSQKHGFIPDSEVAEWIRLQGDKNAGLNAGIRGIPRSEKGLEAMNFVIAVYLKIPR